jgi:AcrR family transcriptional regulator
LSKRGHNTALIGEKTRVQILDAAEKLFAENGPEAVSIRAIADGASVNLGAINYHFVTKERLFEEVFRRRVVPLNDERIALLDAAEKSAGANAAPSLEAIIEAFVSPSLKLAAESAGNARAMVVMQFLSHAFSLPNESAFLAKYYEPLRSRFIVAFMRALPELTIHDVLWRYNFLVGSLIYAMGGPSRMTRLPQTMSATAPKSRSGFDQSMRELVSFASAGFRSPPANRSSSRAASTAGKVAISSQKARKS